MGKCIIILLVEEMFGVVRKVTFSLGDTPILRGSCLVRDKRCNIPVIGNTEVVIEFAVGYSPRLSLVGWSLSRNVMNRSLLLGVARRE